MVTGTSVDSDSMLTVTAIDSDYIFTGTAIESDSIVNVLQLTQTLCLLVLS